MNHATAATAKWDHLQFKKLKTKNAVLAWVMTKMT